MRPTKFRLAAALAGASALITPPGAPRAAEPLTVGFDMSLTGSIAANGKAAMLAMQVWQAGVNAKGGLLGRPVKFDYYDDQSNPAQVPGIVTKLLDVDKVDFLLGGTGTNMVAPAMPLVIQRRLINLSLFALDVNSELHYDRYFSMIPSGGPHPKESFTEGFFKVAETLSTKPKTIAITGADAEFSKNAMDGARSSNAPAIRSSMTTPIRPRRSTTPRSRARSASPTRISCWCAPTRRTPWAWCARCTKSGSRRSCLAAAWSARRRRRSRLSSGR
jgi:hypothetical protein